MKDIIDKIGSYNLFNYLLPGVLYTVLIESFTNYKIIENDLVVAGFLCYFIGLVISRIGSLFVEWVFKYTKFIQYADYNKFIEASKTDPKLEVLSEQNNTYRSLIAMLLSVIVTKGFEIVSQWFAIIDDLKYWILYPFLVLIFTFSWKKQINYINKRVNKQTSTNS